MSPTIDEALAALKTQRASALEQRAAHTEALAGLRGQEAAGQTIDFDTVLKHRTAKTGLDAKMDVLDAKIKEMNDIRADEGRRMAASLITHESEGSKRFRAASASLNYEERVGVTGSSEGHRGTTAPGTTAPGAQFHSHQRWPARCGGAWHVVQLAPRGQSAGRRRA